MTTIVIFIIFFAVPVIVFELTGYLFRRFVGDRLDRWAYRLDDPMADKRSNGNISSRETRFSRSILWTGRVVYVAVFVLVAAIVVGAAVDYFRGNLKLIPTPGNDSAHPEFGP